jgi:hypothetical protein
MLAFGLGTLPLMVGMGFAIGALTRVFQGRILRTLAGVTVMLFGLYTLFLSPSGHGQHRQHVPVESVSPHQGHHLPQGATEPAPP